MKFSKTRLIFCNEYSYGHWTKQPLCLALCVTLLSWCFALLLLSLILFSSLSFILFPIVYSVTSQTLQKSAIHKKHFCTQSVCRECKKKELFNRSTLFISYNANCCMLVAHNGVNEQRERNSMRNYSLVVVQEPGSWRAAIEECEYSAVSENIF
jgi:hypothetical protein